LVGKRDGYLYGYLQVTDKKPVFRKKNVQRLDQNDHLIIALSDRQGKLQKYIISAHQNGWFNAYIKPVGAHNTVQLAREKRLQGFWQLTEKGYNIEFRFPLEMLGNKLGFSLQTVSDKTTRHIDNIISTSNTLNLQQLGTVLIPSPEIQRIVNGMSHTQSRIWVVDRHQRVLAKAGNIHQSNGVWSKEQQQLAEQDSIWGKLQEKLLKPLYALFMAQPSHEFIDKLHDSTQLNSDFITHALKGEAQSSWRFSEDNKAMIISAAQPIMVGNKVMGIVVAEETTNGILSLRNKALEKLFNAALSIIFIATLLLVIFASNIARRVRKLRDQADIAIDVQGRISSPFTPSKSKDEIGDLSRGLADMVNRLGQYHHYLENLSSRLSHELRTPVAVVRSSLENLSLIPQSAENKKYIDRADKGINQLNKILTSMSEATRIEQSLQCSDKQVIAFNELVESCVQGYQMTYSDYQFELINVELAKPLNINVDPDFIVQLFDKLISNAMEFSEQQNSIN
ncbi:MAG: histidine kinase dimerization/phospho-acceptor domain-containing protein, partial [Psychromonas sp.]